MNQKYCDLINQMAIERYGEGYITVKSNDSSRIWINCGDVINIATIYTNDGKYEIYLSDISTPLYTDSIPLLRAFINNVIFDFCDKEIVSLYERNDNTTPTLPKVLADKELKVDTTKLTVERFTEIFNEVTKDVSNGETAESVISFPMVSKLEIRFDIDCGRYGLHRGNVVTINNRGGVKVQLCEYLEGGDIESELKEKILKIIA